MISYPSLVVRGAKLYRVRTQKHTYVKCEEKNLERDLFCPATREARSIAATRTCKKDCLSIWPNLWFQFFIRCPLQKYGKALLLLRTLNHYYYSTFGIRIRLVTRGIRLSLHPLLSPSSEPLTFQIKQVGNSIGQQTADMGQQPEVCLQSLIAAQRFIVGDTGVGVDASIATGQRLRVDSYGRLKENKHNLNVTMSVFHNVEVSLP